MAEITTAEVAGLQVKSFAFSQEIQGRAWYLLFCLFWTTQFIVALGQVSEATHRSCNRL